MSISLNYFYKSTGRELIISICFNLIISFCVLPFSSDNKPNEYEFEIQYPLFCELNIFFTKRYHATETDNLRKCLNT